MKSLRLFLLAATVVFIGSNLILPDYVHACDDEDYCEVYSKEGCYELDDYGCWAPAKHSDFDQCKKASDGGDKSLMWGDDSESMPRNWDEARERYKKEV